MDIERTIAAKAHELAARNVAKATAMFGYRPPAQATAQAAPPAAATARDHAARAAKATARIAEIEAELAAINARAAAESKASWDHVIAKQNARNGKKKSSAEADDDKPLSGWAKVIDRFNRQSAR